MYECVECLHFSEAELPYHWAQCKRFRRELAKHSPHEPLALKEKLLEEENNIIAQPAEEQKKLINHYEGLAKTIAEI